MFQVILNYRMAPVSKQQNRFQRFRPRISRYIALGLWGDIPLWCKPKVGKISPYGWGEEEKREGSGISQAPWGKLKASHWPHLRVFDTSD